MPPRFRLRLIAILLSLASANALLLAPHATAQSARAKLQKQAEESKKQQAELQKRLQRIASDDAGMPTDPQLQSLHRDFISQTEKLAKEYERKRQFDKAREAYQSIVRLVPDYPAGSQGLARVLTYQSAHDKKVFKVQADKGWQDSGAKLTQGMPVKIDVKGKWKVTIASGPQGVELPKELRPRDNQIRWGTLVATIVENQSELDDAKMIRLESGKEFVAGSSGRLYLRMFDEDPDDNQGEMMVLIQSTFDN
ncbi:hypothetical protein SAMN06265222_102296 [Neorhodopirellula lusitana]|uniref:Tetratricopeptide repeat protein n=1 Tax=Neorhodopirellula lusitana TaxID=445327 RepID=A0ABY1PXB4_9BACT|nr:hypothetical protein [Neorhodopirellula lusitana]SMP47428.1 hypothetical protein SAMN06265222_102296 [Neorhodopirellula lusitana]